MKRAFLSVCIATPFAFACGGNPSQGESDNTVASQEEYSTHRARCAPGGGGHLLECSNACPDSLFRHVDVMTDSNQTVYDAAWRGSFVAPSMTAEGLQFGPHPANTNWWDTYSPTETRRSAFGDVLLCVRFHMNAGAQAGANTFQVSLRGGSEGMVLAYKDSAAELSLSTKTSAADTWVTHASRFVWLSEGPHDVELALYGLGNKFFAEMKDLATGFVTPLHATYALPSTGTVGMLGWQLAEPLVVSRAVIGEPTAAARAQISQ